MKRTKRCGFTLVELIVVLVILAVLAALLVPALTGYIDRARKSSVIAETRMIHTAIQSTVSEYYGTGNWAKYKENLGAESVDPTKYVLADKDGTDAQKKMYNQIAELSEFSTIGGDFGGYFVDDGKVAVLMYRDGKGHIGIYFGDTGEYIAYDETDFESFDVYYAAIKNKVRYTQSEEWAGQANRFIMKENILMITGYKGK